MSQTVVQGAFLANNSVTSIKVLDRSLSGTEFANNLTVSSNTTFSGANLVISSANVNITGNITSSGDLTIVGADGKTTLASHDAQTVAVVENNANAQFAIVANSGSSSQLFFGDEDNELVGRIRYDHSNNEMSFYTNSVKSVRITAAGRTDFTTPDNQRAADFYRQTSTTTAHIVNFYSDVSGTQTVQQVMEASGDIESRTSSLTGTSDRTLKENIVDATAQWDDIKALDFKNFNFIGEPDRTMLGVIAQDVQAAGMTGLVKTNAETGKLSVKYSVMFMKAVIALQEAMTKIEKLETEMTALKARVTALENA